MSCAYRSHRYCSGVTAHPPSVSWKPPTGHARHPIPLHPPVVYPHRQVVTETGTSTDDAPIPMSLVQYLWAQWRQAPPRNRGWVVQLVGTLMRSPRWHWDVTVLPDQSLPDPQGSLVSSRDGRWTIGMPITMLQDLWRWVLGSINKRASVLRWLAPTIDPALWQKLHTHQRAHGPPMTKRAWHPLYGYLSPVLLPDIAQATCHLLSSADPNDHQIALTVLDRWMASPDSATRDLAAQMIRAWLNRQAAASPTDDRRRLRALTILASDDDPPVISAHLYHLLRTVWNRITPDDVRTVIDLVITMLHGRGDGGSLAMDRWMSLLGEMVRNHPSDAVIRTVLDRIISAILPSILPDDRVAWATTLWNLVTDPTLSDERRQMVAAALPHMMQDPIVGALLRARLRVHLSPQRIISEPVWDPLLAPLIRTVCADEVVTMIEQALATVRATMETDRAPIVRRLDPILAAGWGHGQDHRILQIIDSLPGPHWHTVLTEGITASVGAEVCARIQAWFPRDQAMALIGDHIYAREMGNWPLAPLPAHLIPWVGAAARNHPYRLHPITIRRQSPRQNPVIRLSSPIIPRSPYDLHPTTIRRLWLADPDRAWDVTKAMLDSDDSLVQGRAILAMDAGWGTGHDAAMATILRSIMDNPDFVSTGIATAVAGIGAAPPSLIAALLTELATTGNTDVQRWLIFALRHGWGRGQDDLVRRVVAIIAEREESSERIWDSFHETLAPAWNHLPSHVVVSLVDRLVTRAMNELANKANHRKRAWWHNQRVWLVSMAEAAITAFAPGWDHLPTAHMIDRIAHHVARLPKHTRALHPSIRDRLVAAWARVIAAGAEGLSASDIHALLDPLRTLSPHGCLKGIAQWVDR